jgi:hypothetical protein
VKKNETGRYAVLFKEISLLEVSDFFFCNANFLLQRSWDRLNDNWMFHFLTLSDLLAGNFQQNLV